MQNFYRRVSKVMEHFLWNDGFDFLGWTFRRFKEKLIVKPSKNSIKTLIKKCATIILKEGKADSQSELIRKLNKVIRGWTNYHRHVVASQAFSYINNVLYLLLQQWAKHRHPNKNKWWRLNKYWYEKNGKKGKIKLKYWLPPKMVKKCLSRKGNPYDNAAAENFFSNMKCECTNFYSFNTRSEAKQTIFEQIEIYYNRQRRHSGCGWISPKKYKQLLMSKTV